MSLCITELRLFRIKCTQQHQAVADQPVFIDLLRDCWASDPFDRPKFASVIVPRLATLLSDVCAKAERATSPVAPSGSDVSGVSDHALHRNNSNADSMGMLSDSSVEPQ